jgi:hypothetical protein
MPKMGDQAAHIVQDLFTTETQRTQRKETLRDINGTKEETLRILL